MTEPIHAKKYSGDPKDGDLVRIRVRKPLSVIFSVRFTADEFIELDEAAERDGRTIGDWIRRSVRGSLDATHYADPANRAITGRTVRRHANQQTLHVGGQTRTENSAASRTRVTFESYEV